jgi:rubrerythrin
MGLVGRNRNLGGGDRRCLLRLDMIATEVLDRRTRRWKINRDFVGQRSPIRALVRHERFERDSRCVGTSGTKHLAATIEAALEVVKDRKCVYDAAMPKECPMCGEFMRLVTRESVSRVPGSAQEVKTSVREWVCPDCDYFEDAETNDSA